MREAKDEKVARANKASSRKNQHSYHAQPRWAKAAQPGRLTSSRSMMVRRQRVRVTNLKSTYRRRGHRHQLTAAVASYLRLLPSRRIQSDLRIEGQRMAKRPGEPGIVKLGVRSAGAFAMPFRGRPTLSVVMESVHRPSWVVQTAHVVTFGSLLVLLHCLPAFCA